jgi:hypothetical protein
MQTRYSNLSIWSVPDEGYSRNTSCAFNLLSTLPKNNDKQAKSQKKSNNKNKIKTNITKKQNKQAKNKNITTQKTEATRTTPTRPCIDWLEQSQHNMTHRQLCHCPSNQLAHFLLHHHIQKGY